MGLQNIAYKDDKVTKPISGLFRQAVRMVGYAGAAFLAELSDNGMAQIDPLSAHSVERLEDQATRKRPRKQKLEMKRTGLFGRKLHMISRSYDPNRNERTVCECTLTFDSRTDRNKAHRLLRAENKKAGGATAIFGNVHRMMARRELKTALILMDNSFAETAPKRNSGLASLFSRKSETEKMLARQDNGYRRSQLRWERDHKRLMRSVGL